MHALLQGSSPPEAKIRHVGFQGNSRFRALRPHVAGVDVKNAKVMVKKYWVDHPSVSALAPENPPLQHVECGVYLSTAVRVLCPLRGRRCGSPEVEQTREPTHSGCGRVSWVAFL